MLFTPSLINLDKAKIRQSFADASKTYDKVAALQRHVGKDLLHTFPPQQIMGEVIDIGCGTGFLTQLLLPYCDNLTALDLALPMLQATCHKLKNSVHYLCADMEKLPILTESIDSLFSNLALQWCVPIDQSLHELYRVLKSEQGELIFSVFGTGTLCELKSAWKAVDNFTHVNEFYESDTLHSTLEKVGFKNLILKKITYTSHYHSVLELMRELKQIGAHNVTLKRNKNLTTKTTLESMIAHYPRHETGKIVATFEVIFVLAKK